MTMSPRDRKRNQLDRQEKALKLVQDSTFPYLRTKFFEHAEMDANWSSVDLAFEMMGIEPPAFEDDRGPAEFARDDCFATDEDKADAFVGHQGSIGRAESMVGLLLDAAMELAGIVNRYKVSELDARLKEVQSMDLSDPQARKRALEAVVHVERVKEALGKNVRRTLPQWEVKGV